MKKKFIILLLITILSSLLAISVRAQEDGPTGVSDTNQETFKAVVPVATIIAAWWFKSRKNN